MVLAISTLIICLAALRAQHQHYKQAHSLLNIKDNAKLSDQLEAKLQAMDDLKAKVELVLLRQGFNRGT